MQASLPTRRQGLRADRRPTRSLRAFRCPGEITRDGVLGDTQRLDDLLLLHALGGHGAHLNPALGDGNLLGRELGLGVTPFPARLEFTIDHRPPPLNLGGELVTQAQLVAHDVEAAADLGRRTVVLREANQVRGMRQELAAEAVAGLRGMVEHYQGDVAFGQVLQHPFEVDVVISAIPLRGQPRFKVVEDHHLGVGAGQQCFAQRIAAFKRVQVDGTVFLVVAVVDGQVLLGVRTDPVAVVLLQNTEEGGVCCCVPAAIEQNNIDCASGDERSQVAARGEAARQQVHEGRRLHADVGTDDGDFCSVDDPVHQRRLKMLRALGQLVQAAQLESRDVGMLVLGRCHGNGFLDSV